MKLGKGVCFVQLSEKCEFGGGRNVLVGVHEFVTYVLHLATDLD